MISTRLKHWVPVLFPVLLSVYFFRRSFRIWFLNDDFAWLGLSLSITNLSELLTALFSPMAQGTVRTLSERLFFLAFEQGFGIESLPMRLFAFVTFAAAQILLVLLVRRLSGSTSAGVWAAVLWSLNAGVAAAMSWLSSYNQILLSALLLGSLYCFILYTDSKQRRYLAGSWVCYLLGFGALENIIVLPGILLVWTLLFEQKHWRLTLPYFIPAILFALVHLFLVPKVEAGLAYRMHFDSSLFSTARTYLTWFLGAVQIKRFGPDWAWLETPSHFILLPSLVVFFVWRTLRRDYLPLFGLLFSLALIGPMLPLRDHRSDYYLASASLGFVMILAILPLRLASLNPLAGRLAPLLLLLYIVPSFIVQQATFEWYLDRTGPIRALFRGLDHATQLHPTKLLLVEGIDQATYNSFLADSALRLIKDAQVRLTPDSPPIGGPLSLAPSAARTVLANQSVIVYRFNGAVLKDVSHEWERNQGLALPSGLSPEIIAGDPAFSSQFLSGWFHIEDGRRWMGSASRSRLGGPFQDNAQVSIRAYAPAILGPIQLRLSANGTLIHQANISPGMIEISVLLPASLQQEAILTLDIQSSKTVRPPQDNRELSLVFEKISIR